MSNQGPRDPREVGAQTGTGTSRSADDGLPEPGAIADSAPDVTDEELVGMTSTSHPADADGLDINRSGSGGSGGPSTEDGGVDDAPGSKPASMEELLTGEDESA